MNVFEYIREKYGTPQHISLLYAEAKILGIPYPLQSGWLDRHGATEITKPLAYRLIQALHKKKSKKFSQAGIAALGDLATVTKEEFQYIAPQKKTKAQKRAAKALQSSFTRQKSAIPRKAIKTHQHQSTQASVQTFIQNHSSIDPASDEFLQSFEWRSLRMMAFKRYGTICSCCGSSPSHGAVLNVDHIKPRKLFPNLALDLNNLQVLCHECNHGKGNWDHTQWRT